MRRVFVALVLAPSAACLFPDLGDLQGDSGAPDVATDARDASSEAGDAAQNSDAADAADAATEAGGSGFCASLGGTHALCEDFDGDAGFTASFPIAFNSTKATLGTDTAAYTSPPRSLLATTPVSNTSGDNAYVQRAFTATASTLTYAFDVRFDSWTTASSPAGVFAAIIIDDGQADFHVLSVYTTATYAALEESFRQVDGGTAYVDHTFTSAFALAAWRRLVITVDLVKRTCAATLDGKSVVVPTLLDASWKPGPLTITLGFTYVAAETQSWQARYDDVVLDFQ